MPPPTKKKTYLEEHELDGELKQQGIETTTKVLVLGNTGVGKSFLCNALLGDQCFESKFQASSVTAKLEFDLYVTDSSSNHAYIVFNIPGLIETDVENIKRNTDCIKHAFNMRPEDNTVVIFVMSNEGGRLKADDLQAWKAISGYVPALEDSAICFVVNKIPADEFDSDEEYEEFCTSIKRTCGDLVNRPKSIMQFFKSMKPKHRKDINSKPMQSLRYQLQNLLSRLVGMVVQPAPDATLELEHDKLKAQIAQMKEDQLALHEKYTEEMKRQSQEHMKELEKQRKENRELLRLQEERMAEEIRSIRAELDRNKQELDEAVRRAKSGEELSAMQKMLLNLLERSNKAGPVPAAGGCVKKQPLTWNTWRTANKGLYDRDGMVKAYHAYKRQFE